MIEVTALSLVTYASNFQCLFQMLKEEITPTLNRLKEERSSFLEYQKIIRELEHLNKLYIAYKFVCAEVGTVSIARCANMLSCIVVVMF